MGSILALRNVLLAALSAPNVDDIEQELFDELTVNKPRLLRVFNFGPRSAQELKEVEAGLVEVDGRPLAVNSEFAQQVNFISKQLSCSERFCSGLLHSVLTENPTIGQVEAAEQAILAYHRVRRDLADCLRFIFEAADAAQKGYARPIHSRLNDFVRRQLVGGGEGSLAYHLFSELDGFGGVIANARIAVTNAVSNTNLGGNGTLGLAVLTARLESLLYERRILAFTFFFLARAGYLVSSEIRQLVEWLDKNPRDDLTPYMLASLLAALDLSHSPPGSSRAELRIALAKDTALVVFIRRKLAPTVDWKDSALKATVNLKWTLFLTEVRFRDATMEHREGFRNEDLEMQIFNAVQGDSFTFLLRVVSALGVPRSTTSKLLSNSLVAPSNESNESLVPVSDEFKLHLLHEIELLLRALLTHAPAELRKIKHKQEDQFRPRADRHLRTMGRPADSAADKTTAQPRNDIAMLFQLLGQLYMALPPDSAIQFWGGVLSTDTPAYYEITEAERGRLPSFLRWAVEVREPDLIISVFDMLAGLATGTACSECAYNFMATGTLDVVHGAGATIGGRYETSAAFTWGIIFGELESWAALGSNQRGQHGVPPPQLPIAPKDVLLGLAFLKLLATVATHSVQARVAIFSHPQYKAVACLVSLIPLGVPLELKGALFETLSAFCHPGAGVQGVEICKSVWTHMERLEVINVRGGGLASKGVEIELEEVETVYKVYPATIPFLELLSTLIHTPKRVPLKTRVTEPEPINTIPDNLGQPHRIPGIGPYINFVVDNVLAKLTRREYMDPSDMWKMADLSLCFLERCLASYDLESLPGLADEYNTTGLEAIVALVHHPGFNVLLRILSDTLLRSSLISYVIEGAEELQRQHSQRFASVILRALRIIDRVLSIQDIFLDLLIPLLVETDSSSLTGSRISQSFLSKIDQGLSLDHRAIPNISSYVNHPAHPEIIFLAINVLASLSQSPSFQNIAVLIERSPDSELVLNGFVRLLATDSADDIGAAEEWADLWTGAGAPDLEGENDLFAQAIRIAVLGLLLRGTKSNKASSLAFLLLFGKTSPDAQIQDPHALGSKETCLHVILRVLGTGIPRLNEVDDGADQRRVVKQPPLFETQPVLAELLYRLVYQLCEHQRTSSSMMLYLRTREDFFARHLQAVAIHAPANAQTPFVEMMYRDGSRVLTTCATLKAFLQLRSWLLDLVSLELHVLTNKGQHQRVQILLGLLFGTTDSYHEQEGDWEHDLFKPFNDVSQSRIRVIELFQSLDFEWFDSVTVSPIDLQFYKALNLQLCLRTDENGCEVVDRSALFELLSDARRTLLHDGHIATMAQADQLNLETKYILESCVVENNRREVQYSLGVAYESWKRLLDVVLTKCFNKIAQDQRENIIFDLLHVLPPTIRSSTLPESSAALLSEVLLLLITKLREERKQAALVSTDNVLELTALPAERMVALLRHILECVLDKQRRELVRGNLYATIINYLHLVSEPLGISFLDDTSASPPLSLILAKNGSERLTSTSKSLEHGSYIVIKQVLDRLATAISKDAIDGTEVWKTMAFSLLESLARLSKLDPKQSILASLDRYGLLSNFVHGLKDADADLQAVLRPEPDDLNALYVYEAKMSFLIRLAQNRQGADKLLENRLLPILSQVDFVDARPEADESFMDQNSFLPPAIIRYHQLLVPALQLVGTMLATLGPKHATGLKQGLDFLYNHRETFIIMLKQDITNLSLSTLEEFNLLVELCGLVVTSVPKTDLFATNTGFGGLHNAVLGLAARTLGTSKWTESVRPVDETEVIESETRFPGYNPSESKFEAKISKAVQKLKTSLITYLSVTNSIEDSEPTVVLSPILTSHDERSSGISVPLPSVKDVVDALDDLCEDLLSTLQDIVDISSELAHKDHVRIDNIEEVIGGDIEDLHRLDAGQRRSLVCRALEKDILKRRTRAEADLSNIEMLLHLLLVHINYYSSNSSSSANALDRRRPFSLTQSTLSQSQSHLKSSTLRLLSVPDAGSFRAEASSVVGRVLEKVGSIKVDDVFDSRVWRASQTYIEVISRCLRESVASERQENGTSRR